MSSDRRRNIQQRKSKRVILVAYEGNNKTEKNYFNNFSSRERDYVIRVVPGNETDPVNLIKQTLYKAQSLALNLLEDDKAYCIFDTDAKKDKDKQIIKAINLANKYNIIPIISTPCVELWFLLHYEYTSSIMDNDKVLDKLKKYYPKYEKNCNIYADLGDKIDIAIKNAKKLEKYQLLHNRKLRMTEANPYTEMYKIVEELIR